jgi:hypothetical protein
MGPYLGGRSDIFSSCALWRCASGHRRAWPKGCGATSGNVEPIPQPMWHRSCTGPDWRQAQRLQLPLQKASAAGR